MHVAIDGFHLAGASRNRGIGTYVRSMLAALARREGVHVTLTSPGPVDVPGHVDVVAVPARAPGPRGFLEHAWRAGPELVATGADVVHLPGPPPPVRRGPRPPLAVTLHDVFPLTMPATAGRRERGLVRISLPLARRADLVVVPSHHTAVSLHRLGFSPDQVRVVPNAVDPAFGPAGPTVPALSPFLLCVAGPDPRKRRTLALDVVDGVRAAGLPHQLVLVGAQTADQEARLRGRVAERGLEDRVVIANHVDDLAPYYRGATAVLVCSAAEGFGYPALEAMACGTPVVGFDNSATSEVVRGAGILVPDGDVGAMTRSTVDLLVAPEQQDRLARAGLDRAGDYDLDSFADGLLAAWGSVVARSSR